MAAQPSVDDSFTFVGGLFTEGSFFLTPKNSWKEGDNVIPKTDGSLIRRPALDYEVNFQVNDSVVTIDPTLDNLAFCIETWTSVGGNGNLDLFVVQRGPIIEFYKAFSGTVGAGRQSTTIDLNTYRCFGNTNVIGSNVITAASCYGRLLITSVDTNPVLVTYNPETEAITHQAIELRVRDFDGVRSPAPEWREYSRADWSRFNFLSGAIYNLFNQGWDDSKIATYEAATGRLPANTKVWWYGKNSSDVFDVPTLNNNDFGTSQAPRGRFILNAFYQDRARALALGPYDSALTPPPVLGSPVPSTPDSGTFDPIVPYYPVGGDGGPRDPNEIINVP